MSTMSEWLKHQFDYVISGDDICVSCPFCGDAKHHMYISMTKPVAHCFRCDWKGTHFSFVKEFLGADSYAEVWSLVRKPAVADVSRFDSIRDRLVEYDVSGSHGRINQMPEWYVPFADVLHFDAHASIVLKYAMKRLTWENIVRYGIGVCTDASLDSHRFRMIIPVERGYYQARSISNNGARKYNNPKDPIGDRLFNSGALLGNDIFIAEGAISAIAIGNNAVAVLGHNINREQRCRIANSSVDNVTIAMDADSTWCESAMKTADHLLAAGKHVMIRQYSEGDPDSCCDFVDEEYGMAQKVAHRLGL